jgi:hypothetical protein
MRDVKLYFGKERVKVYPVKLEEVVLARENIRKDSLKKYIRELLQLYVSLKRNNKLKVEIHFKKIQLLSYLDRKSVV